MSREYLEKLFTYEDGFLIWKPRDSARWNSANAGNRAGYMEKSGYTRGTLAGKRHLVHRIIWTLVNGSPPEGNLDHIDGDRSNNKIENLRACSAKQNQGNRRHSKNNTSGYRGVSFNYGKFVARLRKGKTLLHLGCFDTAEDAAAAYRQAAIEYFGEFYNE